MPKEHSREIYSNSIRSVTSHTFLNNIFKPILRGNKIFLKIVMGFFMDEKVGES